MRHPGATHNPSPQPLTPKPLFSAAVQSPCSPGTSATPSASSPTRRASQPSPPPCSRSVSAPTQPSSASWMPPSSAIADRAVKAAQQSLNISTESAGDHRADQPAAESTVGSRYSHATHGRERVLDPSPRRRMGRFAVTLVPGRTPLRGTLSAARQSVACGGARARSGDRQRADRIASIAFVLGDPDFKSALPKAAESRPSHFRFMESVVALHWPAFKSFDQESQDEWVGAHTDSVADMCGFWKVPPSGPACSSEGICSHTVRT